MQALLSTNTSFPAQTLEWPYASEHTPQSSLQSTGFLSPPLSGIPLPPRCSHDTLLAGPETLARSCPRPSAPAVPAWNTLTLRLHSSPLISSRLNTPPPRGHQWPCCTRPASLLPSTAPPPRQRRAASLPAARTPCLELCLAHTGCKSASWLNECV